MRKKRTFIWKTKKQTGKKKLGGISLKERRVPGGVMGGKDQKKNLFPLLERQCSPLSFGGSVGNK